jgi:hypothetical protein
MRPLRQRLSHWTRQFLRMGDRMKIGEREKQRTELGAGSRADRECYRQTKSAWHQYREHAMATAH